jgi:hypothetical protein
MPARSRADSSTELRCPNKLFGELVEEILEVKCHSRFCGHEAGVVVIHLFDLSSGKMIETKRYRDPRKEK